MGATLIASNCTRYNNGNAYSDESSLAGIHPDNSAIRVVRYTFTTGSLGAVSYSLMLTGVSKHRTYDPVLRFYLTTSSTGYEKAGSTYSYDGTLTRRSTTSGYGQYEYYANNISKSLSANTTYYLWVFPGSTSAGCAFLPCDGQQYATDLASITLGLAPGYVNLSSTSGSVTYGSSTTFTVSSHHGGSLSVSSSNTGVATASISGTTVTVKGVGVGSASITVTSGSNSSYTQAGRTYSISVGKAGGWATAPTAKSLTYTGSAQTLINAGSGSGTMYYSTTSATSGFSTTLPSATNAGSYTVWYYAAASTNYNQSSTGNISVTIAKKAGSVSTAPSAKSLTYNGSAQALVNAGSGTGTMYYSTTSASSGFSTSIPTGTGAGSYTVWYYAASGTNYNQSSTGSVSVTIGKASGSVTTKPTAKTLTYTGSAQTVANAGSGTGTMYYRLGTSGSYSTTIPTATTAGSYTLYYYAAASTNYNQSSTGSISVSIGKASGSVSTAPTAKSLTYTGGAQALVNAGSGTGTMYYRIGTSGNFSASIPTATDAGTYAVYYYAASATNYNQSSTGGPVNVTIGKASGSVSTKPTAKTGLVYSGYAQTLVNSGSGTGTMYYSTTSASSGFGTSLPTKTDAGTYTVWFYAAASANYNQSSTDSLTVTISKEDGWVILSANSGSTTYGVNKTFTISDHHGGSLSVVSSDTSVATASISGSTITMVPKKSGSTTITVTSAASTNYSADSSAYVLTVDRANGWVTLSEQSGSATCGTSKSIEVVNHHGGELSAKSANESIVTVNVNGTTIVFTLNGGGETTITVTSASTDQYASASSIYTITVQAGLVYIDTGDELIACQVYVDDGKALVLLLPYVDAEDEWELYS